MKISNYESTAYQITYLERVYISRVLIIVLIMSFCSHLRYPFLDMKQFQICENNEPCDFNLSNFQ